MISCSGTTVDREDSEIALGVLRPSGLSPTQLLSIPSTWPRRMASFIVAARAPKPSACAHVDGNPTRRKRS